MFSRVFASVLFACAGGLVAPKADARCPEPSGLYVDQAKAQFACSSARPVRETGQQLFRIKLDFPTTEPSSAGLPWQLINFEREPEAYLHALLAYGIRDNSDPAIDWRIEKNTKSTWCHAPWFHPLREGLRGMTSERGSRVKELHEIQLEPARNWAIGFYNDRGCYALGRVWKDPAYPKTKNFKFPEGAYSIKLLFTTASPKSVPYLTGSKEWDAAINDDGSSVQMRLLQVDVAVRDARADKWTGWLFGTFIYDAYAPGDTVWERLVPVGLMWGNDPNLTSAEYEFRGGVPREAWLNPDVAKKFFHLPRHTLGLHGRVNGPVDNPKASCLACHGRALDWGRPVVGAQQREAEQLLPFAPNPYDDAAVKKYFRNLKPDQPFVDGTQSLDYSLQLAAGIANFRSWVQQKFPGEVRNVSDVPPYRFPSEEAGPAMMERLRTMASPGGASDASKLRGQFSREDEELR